MTTVDADTLRARLSTLEAKLAQQTQQRDQARDVYRSSQVAVHQLEGAVLVLRDLLSGRAATTNGAEGDS